MGFRSKEESHEADRSSSSSVPSLEDVTQGSDRSRASSGGSLTPEDCESQFGLEVYRSGMEVQIQRLVDSQGAAQVKQWADEGMTVDTMGKPRDMEAFRERQAERPAEVPRDIERRYQKSVQRSKGAHHEASKAGDSNVPDSVRDVISSSGQSLDTSIQRAMENRMGDSFGEVRVHTGPKAAKACQDINAKAFTAGNHIAFNHGEYDPESPEGQHLLAHELAHVRQQTGGAISMMPQADANLQIDPDPRLEREAEEAAKQAMQGGPVVINRMGAEMHIQRKDWNSGPSNTERLSTGEGPGFVEEKVDEATTKTYRLTREELVDLVETVDSPDELPEHISDKEIEAASSLQDSMSSGVGGAMKGWKAGSAVGSLAGPAGTIAGGLTSMPIGYVFAKKFGDQTADEIQKRLRDLADLNNDQLFNADDVTGSETVAGQSRGK